MPLAVNQFNGFGVGGGYNAFGADFDGSSDFMERGGDLTGSVDGKVGILSFWIRIDGADDTFMRIFNSTGSRMDVLRKDDNTMRVFARRSGGTTILTITTTGTFLQSATWRHVLASWNLADSNSGRLYLDDVSDYNEAIFINDTIDYSVAENTIGADSVGNANKLSACLSNFYLNEAEYLDFNTELHRRKFRSAAGKPVDLGFNGARPTGTAPIMFFPNPFGTQHENEGTGGDFTVTGALTECSTNPSD